ncbi:Bug family tripartite tricarboxylate transporter substrate binding protein [Siccirubricoccus phaeus]|uniref:Bug family tripartite tricarboxylate transporter substrate binding protein n=1 Tax=Siccirubricoccus phaeus TaxID=2595053 RepID=UPI0011F32909|nr:tripartite tricarboxylate transporter substrate binding protein [Siccirubricoccus phaeus]
MLPEGAGPMAPPGGISRRGLGVGLVGLALPGLALPAAAQGQAWPGDRVIEAIVPYPPGGGVDIVTRLMMPLVGQQLGGARIVVTNRPGASGQLGFEYTFHAAADGYLLCAVSSPVLQAIPLERQARYRTLEFTFLANAVDDANVVLVLADSPLQTLADLAAAAKARPGGLSYGSTGVGSDDHIAMLAFEAGAGLPPMVHVPFNGAAPSIQALLGGHIDLLVANASDGLALRRDGKVRYLGQASVNRWSALADVPTFREQGFDVLMSATRGFVAPPGLPAPMRERLEAAFTAVFADAGFRREAERLGIPLRPLVGGAYASMAAETEAGLRQLWQVRPWKEG